MNFEVELSSRVEYVNAVIREYLPEETGFQKTIFEAMNTTAINICMQDFVWT